MRRVHHTAVGVLLRGIRPSSPGGEGLGSPYLGTGVAGLSHPAHRNLGVNCLGGPVCRGRPANDSGWLASRSGDGSGLMGRVRRGSGTASAGKSGGGGRGGRALVRVCGETDAYPAAVSAATQVACGLFASGPGCRRSESKRMPPCSRENAVPFLQDRCQMAVRISAVFYKISMSSG